VSVVWLIAKRELGATLRSPSGYVIAALILLLDGLAFNVWGLGGSAKKSFDVLSQFLYYTSGFTAMGASILLSKRAAYSQAGVAILCVGGVLWGEQWGILPHYHLVGLISAEACPVDARYLMGVSVALATTLFITVYMATSIVDQLRIREQE